jgi:hypothetical protein
MDVVNAERFASLRVLVLDNKYPLSQPLSLSLYFFLSLSFSHPLAGSPHWLL